MAINTVRANVIIPLSFTLSLSPRTVPSVPEASPRSLSRAFRF
jgi:hypothetical protein